MRTAKQWDAADNRPEPYTIVLGKLLAVGVILGPLVMMLFQELNRCSGNTSHGRQDAPAVRAPTLRALTPARALIPDSFGRNDK
jgi:hypothetical protein